MWWLGKRAADRMQQIGRASCFVYLSVTNTCLASVPRNSTTDILIAKLTTCVLELDHPHSHITAITIQPTQQSSSARANIIIFVACFFTWRQLLRATVHVNMRNIISSGDEFYFLMTAYWANRVAKLSTDPLNSRNAYSSNCFCSWRLTDPLTTSTLNLIRSSSTEIKYWKIVEVPHVLTYFLYRRCSYVTLYGTQRESRDINTSLHII